MLAGLKELRQGILASCGTDGIDGNTDAAGAIGDRYVSETARANRYDINDFLENNDFLFAGYDNYSFILNNAPFCVFTADEKKGRVNASGCTCGWFRGKAPSSNQKGAKGASRGRGKTRN